MEDQKQPEPPLTIEEIIRYLREAMYGVQTEIVNRMVDRYENKMEDEL